MSKFNNELPLRPWVRGVTISRFFTGIKASPRRSGPLFPIQTKGLFFAQPFKRAYNESMNSQSIQNIVRYWLKTAKHDYDTMVGLYSIKRYSDCLFYGHIVLEKILKAHVVKATGKQSPYTHDLARLHEIAGLNLSQETVDLLNQVNDFNIRARYPEHKLRFYKTCTASFTRGYFEKINTLYLHLCQLLKLKKS